MAIGTASVLSRVGGAEVARGIERGQKTVLKSLSRAPLAIQEIIMMGEEMLRDQLSARDIIQIGDPILTDELIEEKQIEFAKCAEDIGKQYKRILQARQKL